MSAWWNWAPVLELGGLSYSLALGPSAWSTNPWMKQDAEKADETLAAFVS